MDDDRNAWIRLSQARGVGAHTLRVLLTHFGSARSVVEADLPALSTGIGPKRARALKRSLRAVRPGEIERQAGDVGQRVLTPSDDGYPHAAFTSLSDPPCALFVRGALPDAGTPAVALVGTREATRYGLENARTLAEDLARAGCWIVSGFALGVDAAAHAGALAGGGRTLAVLGCGVDVAYPAAHADLKEEIVERGGCCSEHPPGVEPQRWHFPMRNRLVAALSDATVVIEAPHKSGALITAQLAVECGREVLAVPGHVRRRAQRGCHGLIKRGAAALCEGAADVLEALGLEREGADRPTVASLEGPARVVWEALDWDQAVESNALCRATGLAAHEVAEVLTLLELDGRVRRTPGVGYTRL